MLSNRVACNFCKQNGEVEEFYYSHKLRDENNKIICPVLKNYTCPTCKVTGKHTASYCPKNNSSKSKDKDKSKLKGKSVKDKEKSKLKLKIKNNNDGENKVINLNESLAMFEQLKLMHSFMDSERSWRERLTVARHLALIAESMITNALLAKNLVNKCNI